MDWGLAFGAMQACSAEAACLPDVVRTTTDIVASVEKDHARQASQNSLAWSYIFWEVCCGRPHLISGLDVGTLDNLRRNPYFSE